MRMLQPPAHGSSLSHTRAANTAAPRRCSSISGNSPEPSRSACARKTRFVHLDNCAYCSRASKCHDDVHTSETPSCADGLKVLPFPLNYFAEAQCCGEEESWTVAKQPPCGNRLRRYENIIRKSVHRAVCVHFCLFLVLVVCWTRACVGASVFVFCWFISNLFVVLVVLVC